MPAIKRNPTQGLGTPTPPLPAITQLTSSGTASMSTLPTPLSFERKRAQIVAARRLLNDALKNDYLITDLPDHLPACTCGSVMHAISNYREVQLADLKKNGPPSGLKVSTMGSAPEEIIYIAHVLKWELTRKFKNLDDLDNWFYPAYCADSVAMENPDFYEAIVNLENSRAVIHQPLSCHG